VSWRVPWHRACLPAGEGFGVAMCPMVPNPPPSAGGIWCRHVSLGFRRPMGHKQKGNSQSVYLLGWAHLPSRHARAFLRRLTLGSSLPCQAHGVGSALNTYKTVIRDVWVALNMYKTLTQQDGDSTV
jgi:hypothetical protein